MSSQPQVCFHDGVAQQDCLADTSDLQASGGNNADPDTESWSAVEGELKTHDQQMVKDYAEDVDNLLVFVSRSSLLVTLASY